MTTTPANQESSMHDDDKQVGPGEPWTDDRPMFTREALEAAKITEDEERILDLELQRQKLAACADVMLHNHHDAHPLIRFVAWHARIAHWLTAPVMEELPGVTRVWTITASAIVALVLVAVGFGVGMVWS